MDSSARATEVRTRRPRSAVALPVVRTRALPMGRFLAELLPLAADPLDLMVELSPRVVRRERLDLVGVRQHRQAPLAGSRPLRLFRRHTLVRALADVHLGRRVGLPGLLAGAVVPGVLRLLARVGRWPLGVAGWVFPLRVPIPLRP